MISNKCLNHKEPNLYRSLENISNSMVSKKTMKKLCPDFELHWKEVSTNVRLYGGNEALHLLVI